MEDPTATHFIGSLVLAPSPANGPTGVQEFLVIDGQQRLTTMSILLCAVRDHRKEHDSPEHFDRVSEQYLINKWKKGPQRLKLLPTQAVRDAYRACVELLGRGAGWCARGRGRVPACMAARALADAADSEVGIGGADLGGQALQAGIVDVLTLVLFPVIIGRGLRVIPEDLRLDLQVIEWRDFSRGIVQLTYRVPGVGGVVV